MSCSLLRRELSAFDDQFFDELEQLKRGYVQLQGIAGQDPYFRDVGGCGKIVGEEIRGLPSTRRDPSRVSDRASIVSALHTRRTGIAKPSSWHPSEAIEEVPGSGTTISPCERHLMKAMRRLVNPLKVVRKLCRM